MPETRKAAAPDVGPGTPLARGESASPLNPRYTGAPFVRTWTAEDYNAAPVNYDVLQHPRTGFLYAANNYGVLEFDGATWRVIEMPNAAPARTLAVDAHGRVWVGGSDEIAVLVPDARGTLVAVSMLERLPERERATGLVTLAAAGRDAVYFGTAKRIYRFTPDGPARAWSLPRPIESLTVLGDVVYCGTADGGGFALEGDAFTPVNRASAESSTGAALRARILAARSAASGGYELLTAKGPMRWAGPGSRLVPVSAEAVAYFAAEPAGSAVFLADGRAAFGHVLGGVAVFDRAGKLVQRIERAHGLLGNRVEKLCEDAEGGLWIAQRAGLARVQLDSPFARHTIAQGVDGRPRALHRHEGRLYVAHNEGAAWRDDATGQFHAIGGLTIGLTRFFSVGSRLLATTNALYEVTPEAATPLVRQAFTPLLPLEVAGDSRPWLLGGGATGVSLLAPERNTWRVTGTLSGLHTDVASLLRGLDGFVWGVSDDGRISRIDFRQGPSLDAPVALYGPEQGVPRMRHRDAELLLFGTDVIATSSLWILRYDRASDRFVPETRIAGLPAGVGVTRAHTDGAGTLWLQLSTPSVTLFRIRPDGPPPWHAKPLPLPAVAGLVVNRMYHDEMARTLWVASQGALVSIDLTWAASRTPPAPAVHVRRVETAGRELIFGGATNEAPPTRSGGSRVRVLPPAQDALRFTFAAPAFVGDFLGHAQTLYRTRLDGLETAWTDWSPDTVREFSNLPFRTLTFRVEARGPDGRSGPAETWTFAIAPPWWLTGWAMGGYALLGLSGVAGLVRWRTQRLRRRADELTAIVATRTEELRRSNEELSRLHAIERDEKLAARLDEEKARLELLRYQLNPHFLYNTLASICGTARTNPDATRTMAQRLADFCRLTLTRPDEMDTVHEEVRMMRSYLDIEQARWRDQLQVAIEVGGNARERRLPTFLLLPLVENAIKHGGRTTRGTLRLRVSIQAAGETGLAIEVANTGVWDPARVHPDSTGIGLENLRRRLRRYYPATHEFSIGAKAEWVVAQLTIAAS